MAKKPKLKVIRTGDQCCKRGLSCACQHDKLSAKDETGCPWWINSKEYGYCFWKYVREKSSPDGVMKELVQSELAQLFGYSNTKTHFVLKQAMDELKAALVDADADEFLESPSGDEDAQYAGDLDFPYSFEEPE